MEDIEKAYDEDVALVLMKASSIDKVSSAIYGSAIINAITAVTITLMALKLCGVIGVSWWVVTTPVLVPLLIALVLAIAQAAKAD